MGSSSTIRCSNRFWLRPKRSTCPSISIPASRRKPCASAYYDGFDEAVSYSLATASWGWHAETAVHILRLVVSGTLDRHPGLRLIIGHMGEGLPAMLTRFDAGLGRACKNLQRSVSETIMDQVVITTSGLFALPAFLAALMTFGADRILFSVDYPFGVHRVARGENEFVRDVIGVGCRFLDALPVSESDREKIAHGNADRILKLGAYAPATV